MKRLVSLLAFFAFVFTFATAQELEGGRYKGFLDAIFGLNKIEAGPGLRENSIGLTTSHGYQINPYLYTGAGVGMHYYSKGDGIVGLPLFANIRANLCTGAVTPFIDAKVGYSPMKKVRGLYFSPSFGLRMGVDGNGAANLTIGYTMQKRKLGEVWDYVVTPNGLVLTDNQNFFASAIQGFYVSIGFDF